MDRTSEYLKPLEKHERIRHKSQPRIKLAKGLNALRKNAGKIAAVALATGIAIEANNLLKGQAYEPNAFYNGEVEIIMSDNLNVRTSPNINKLHDGQSDNIVQWNNIDKILTKGGDWIDIKGGNSFILYTPAIYKVDQPHPLDPWITFNAKVSGLFGEQEERLYINFSSKTEQFVKRQGPGSIYELGGNSGTDLTGTITVQK